MWFGGFDSIVREMNAENYDFFLDEVIHIRNRWLAAELSRKGQKPYLVPLAALAETVY